MTDLKTLDPPRVVTDREIFDSKYGTLHGVCMKIACKEASGCAKEFDIPIANFDISALTYQLFRIWVDKEDYIKALAIKKQEELDKQFKK